MIKLCSRYQSLHLNNLWTESPFFLPVTLLDSTKIILKLSPPPTVMVVCEECFTLTITLIFTLRTEYAITVLAKQAIQLKWMVGHINPAQKAA